ncbi:MAG: hypothetical protein VKO21_03915 [Candidatus Sericytochromatia bacterium]|nr:hypothetical protein [Candidatus Sericytochromatia bacterium]
MPWTTKAQAGLLAMLAIGLHMPATAQQPLPSKPGSAATGPAKAETGNPEFGAPPDPQPASASASPSAQPAKMRESKIDNLVREARMRSGREDPFRSLLKDPQLQIAPLPLPVIQRPKVTPPPVIVPPPGKVARTVRRLGPGGRFIEEIIYLDPDEPLWELQGVLNTGREALAVLELDGLTREARIGEILEDGSKVVGISANQVVLLSRGRRFVKNIGGQATP